MSGAPSTGRIAASLVAAVGFMTGAGWVIMSATSPTTNEVLKEMQSGGRDVDVAGILLLDSLLGSARAAKEAEIEARAAADAGRE
ncbi:uncharacterized protein AMSG_08031 [Thecamonas trahens ATCC 50062]|uniref:Uncharacterized protein n=1 Tax=Thecamonas trahens ATCC 50062 TaxID=461836 RepID=A0A0L0DJ92_THETB|nr:hypothetical protein AMSG_08031 [Thecamonas trahens ATCC 50062]KNC52474.1 hypothetical protein AMSG_08031 [Thecamonas trahens ATCC 50062]|eukprot:XP_013755274.1 hypothetical protein AMSG_08031 [Thecamonas trahens ATCC 50062]